MRSIEIGRVCKSISGRDKNELYIITEVVNENYVMVANGDSRKTDNPKLKNIKHIITLNILTDFNKSEINAKNIKEKNAEIRKKLNSLK